VLKSIQYVLFVFGEDEGCKGHVVEHLDVVPLIRLLATGGFLLNFKHGPTVVEQNQEVWDPLAAVRILLDYETPREHDLQSSHEVRLESRFEHGLSFRK
jgi:hypothetical protein